jgi:hypothetical protein
MIPRVHVNVKDDEQLLPVAYVGDMALFRAFVFILLPRSQAPPMGVQVQLVERLHPDILQICGRYTPLPLTPISQQKRKKRVKTYGLMKVPTVP